MLQLPNELIREIIILSDTKSDLAPNLPFSQFYRTRAHLLSLCLACKLFRQLTLEILYSDVRVDGIKRMHRVLRSILRNKELGKYVRSLQITWQDKIDRRIKRGTRNMTYQVSKRKISKPILFSELEELYQAALDYRLGSSVTDYVKARSEGATALVLLRSLPNLILCTIEPPYTRQSIPGFNIELPFDQIGRLIGGRFLHKVQTIQYKQDNSSVGDLAPFLFLPSVRTVVAEEVNIMEKSSLPREWYEQSPVRRLFFSNCNVSVSTFSQLLKIPSSLESVVFEKTKVSGQGISISREGFATALSVVSKSLKYLHLALYTGFIVYDSDTTRVGSLDHFTSLISLAIGVEDLLGITPSADVQLANFLPPNLEELQLTTKKGETQWKTSDYAYCIRELLNTQLKTRKFRNLRTIGAGNLLLMEILEHLGILAAEAGVTVGHFIWVAAEDGAPHEEFVPIDTSNVQSF